MVRLTGLHIGAVWQAALLRVDLVRACALQRRSVISPKFEQATSASGHTLCLGWVKGRGGREVVSATYGVRAASRASDS
jgi:hypothetical protein